MAVLRIRIGGKWVSLADSGSTLDASKEYTDKVKDELSADITALEGSIADTNDYLDNAFRDGVITETEARRIRTYLNTVQTSKNNLDQRTAKIVNNPDLPTSRKEKVNSVKANFDSVYTSLVDTINSVIADNKVTSDEVASVDSKFSEYNGAVSLLVEQLELAISDSTQSKVDAVIQHSSIYTSQMRSALDIDVLNAQKSTQTLEDYLDTASSDGIIYDAELTKVRTYMKEVETDKSGLVTRYSIIYNDGNLTDETAKSNLSSAKISLDSSYDSLVSILNSCVIADQLVDSSELLEIKGKFSDYKNAISLFSASSETAINSILKVKGDRANATALAYANAEKSSVTILDTDFNNALSKLEDDIDSSFVDGTITDA